MKTLNFKKIDAFTDGSSSGNPAGCFYLKENEKLSHDEMLKIAYELKDFVSEVGFVQPAGDEFNLKYYSSEREVDFCGHATIAIMYDLISSDTNLLKKSEVFINVNAGRLSVFNEIPKEDAVYIMAPAPEYLAVDINSDIVATALEIDTDDIDINYSIEIVNGGLKTLIVPIKTLETCISISPDLQKLKVFCKGLDVDIIHIFTPETHFESSHYRTRVFPATFGYLEDPATGSGNAAFGYYLIKNNRWTGDMIVEQSGVLENPNFVKLKKHQTDNETRILFGGRGITKIDGKYFLT